VTTSSRKEQCSLDKMGSIIALDQVCKMFLFYCFVGPEALGEMGSIISLEQACTMFLFYCSVCPEAFQRG